LLAVKVREQILEDVPTTKKTTDTTTMTKSMSENIFSTSK
jgi:hypothetical protein